MGSHTGVRPRRTARRRGLTVAVTNAAGPAGRAVVRALRDHAGIGPVVAVDTRRGAVEGVTWRLADPSSPSVGRHLEGVDAIVHLACVDVLGPALLLDGRARRAKTVRAAQAVLTAAAAVGASQVVVVTSAMVYGAPPDNPVPIPEGAPLAAVPDDGLVGDLLEVEQVAAAAVRSHPGLGVAVVRPGALVGPGVDTVITRHFEAPRLLALKDDRMAWQFCHVDDLASAVALTVTAGLDGPLTVASPGALNQAAVEGLSGMRRIELPSALAFSTAERLHRLGVLPTPAGDLAYVVHPWVVGSARLREAGWSAVYDNETCLGVLMAEVSGRNALAARRVGGKDAALGAAGAAVAVVGTAAVWRQARARRRRGG